MDNRTLEANASATPPSAPAMPSVGYPQKGNPSTGTAASKGGVFWYYQIGEELRNVLLAAGLTPSTGDLTQVVTAIKTLIEARAGNYSLDTGVANAYVVALSPAVTAYTNGMEVRVKIVNANTAASTLNAGGGAVPLVNDVGSVLVSGDLPANCVISAVYDSTANKFIMTSLVPSQAMSQAAADARYVQRSGGGVTGTMLMWPTLVAPSWALVRDGSAISRATYAALYAALCPTRNGTTTNSSNAVTGLSTTSDMYVGMPIEGTGIPAGTTVASITSSSAITMSSNATASATVSITLFYYGYGSGGSGTTFGVPDDRGVFERGLDTGAAARDTLTYSCTNTNGTALIAGLSSTAGMSVGMALSGTGVAGGATIAQINSATSITMSANSTSAVSSITVTGNRIGNYSGDQFALHNHVPSNLAQETGSGNFTAGSTGAAATSANIGNSGNTETKPKNRAYLPIIVY